MQMRLFSRKPPDPRSNLTMAASCAGLLFSLLVLAGGGATVHSILNFRSVAEAKPLGTNVYPAYTGSVFLTECELPSCVWAPEIAVLEAGTASEKPTDAVLNLLAAKAREVGGNAVIRVKVWRQPSGFTWHAPHGSGVAVQLCDTNATAGMNGYWR